MTPRIAGWTPMTFGRLDALDLEVLIAAKAVADASLAGMFNMDVSAVTSCVSIVERAR